MNYIPLTSRKRLAAADISMREISDLVDAIVEAADVARVAEVDRLRLALVPFGLVGAFDDELRLSGSYSDSCEWCCGVEVGY